MPWKYLPTASFLKRTFSLTLFLKLCYLHVAVFDSYVIFEQSYLRTKCQFELFKIVTRLETREKEQKEKKCKELREEERIEKKKQKKIFSNEKKIFRSLLSLKIIPFYSEKIYILKAFCYLKCVRRKDCFFMAQVSS